MVCDEQPVSVLDSGCIMLSEVEDVHSSNGVVNVVVGVCSGSNEGDEMA